MSRRRDAIGWYVTQVLNNPPCSNCGNRDHTVEERYDNDDHYVDELCDDCWEAYTDDDSLWEIEERMQNVGRYATPLEELKEFVGIAAWVVGFSILGLIFLFILGWMMRF